jgi:hypothetical protein
MFMSRSWRTIFRSPSKRVLVRPGRRPPPVHIRPSPDTGVDWLGIVGFLLSAALAVGVLYLLWELLPVLLVCAVVGIVLSALSK